VALTQFDENDVFIWGRSLTLVTYTSPSAIMPQLTRPVRIDQILATSNDTIDHHLRFYLSFNLSENAYLGAVDLPAGSGHTQAVPPVDVFPTILATLDHLNLGIYDDLQLYIDEAITTLKLVHILVTGGYF
jgi:hypothetical protein